MFRSLDDAVSAQEPLIDIIVVFKDGVDYAEATRIANALGPDLYLNSPDWYNDPRLRIGCVTVEGALRHFGVRVRRVPLANWNDRNKRYEGVHKDFFRWDQVEIFQWPEPLAPFVEGIGITQPGADDDGQPIRHCLIDNCRNFLRFVRGIAHLREYACTETLKLANQWTYSSSKKIFGFVKARVWSALHPLMRFARC